LYCHR